MFDINEQDPNDYVPLEEYKELENKNKELEIQVRTLGDEVDNLTDENSDYEDKIYDLEMELENFGMNKLSKTDKKRIITDIKNLRLLIDDYEEHSRNVTQDQIMNNIRGFFDVIEDLI